jgi:hypothetical protein
VTTFSFGTATLKASHAVGTAVHSQEVRRTSREADHSPTTGIKVKNAWNCAPALGGAYLNSGDKFIFSTFRCLRKHYIIQCHILHVMFGLKEKTKLWSQWKLFLLSCRLLNHLATSRERSKQNPIKNLTYELRKVTHSAKLLCREKNDYSFRSFCLAEIRDNC